MAKSKTKDDLMASLQKKLDDAVNKATYELATELNYEITIEYERALQKFYDDYRPKWYDRTYSLFYGFENYDTPSLNVIKDGNGYIVGAMMSSSNIQGKPYRAETEWVFSRSIFEGIHGFCRADFDKWSDVEGSVFGTRIGKIPKVSKPAPERRIKKSFKRITKDAVIRKRFQKMVSDSFVNG